MLLVFNITLHEFMLVAMLDLNKEQNMLFRISRFLFRLFSTTFILTLPIGYYYQDTDSTAVAIGVHGGAGQVATIIRGCEGNKLASVQNTYREFSASVYVPFPPRKPTPIIIGLRGGSFRSQAKPVSYESGTQQVGWPVSLRAWYLNPNFNLEYKAIGIGLGFGLGNMPYSFEEFNVGEPDNETRAFIMSGHLRLGNSKGFHINLSVAENEPIASGGDIVNIGIGYPVGNNAMLYTGLAAGFCDKSGLVQQVRVDLSKNLSFDLAVRLGKSEGIGENAISGGLVFKIGN
jgi:hypothetical protein